MCYIFLYKGGMCCIFLCKVSFFSSCSIHNLVVRYLETVCYVSCPSSNSYPLVSVWNWWFSSFIIPSVIIIWNYTVRKSLPFASIHLFISRWTLESCFLQWVLTCYYHLFWCSDCRIFSQWEPLQVGPCALLTFPLHSLNTSLLSGTRYCRFFFHFLSLLPGISHFFKELWFSLLEGEVWKPGFRHWLCSLVLGHHCF